MFTCYLFSVFGFRKIAIPALRLRPGFTFSAGGSSDQPERRPRKSGIRLTPAVSAEAAPIRFLSGAHRGRPGRPHLAGPTHQVRNQPHLPSTPQSPPGAAFHHFSGKPDAICTKAKVVPEKFVLFNHLNIMYLI
jgi:hypothetical protein